MLGGPEFQSGQFEGKNVPRLLGIEHRFPVVYTVASGRYIEIYFCIIFIFIIAAPFDTGTRLVLIWYTKH